MKRLFVFGVMMLLIGHLGFATDTQISFRTVLVPGEHAPKHVLAVWIEDANGVYINTVALYARERQGYLVAWSASSNTIMLDGVTGATLRTHTSHELIWNGKNFRGVEVPNGSYFLRIEMCSHNDVPNAKLAFDKLDTNFETTYPDETYFKDIKVSQEGLINDLAEIESNVSGFKAFMSGEQQLELSFMLKKAEFCHIQLYDLNGRIISNLLQRDMTSGEQRLNFKLESNMNAGIYILELVTGSERVSQKIIFQP